MKKLRRSRKPVQPGDVFVFQILPDQFHFGRVIRIDISMMGDDNILIYIYRATSRDKYQIPSLDKQDLLIPPIITNRFMWLRGYFESVKHSPLNKDDLLKVHCFHDPMRNRYFDENWREIAERVEPCGNFGMYTELGIDKALSDALNISRSPASIAADSKHERCLKTKEKVMALATEARKLSARKSPTMQRLLAKLLKDMEDVGKQHAEIYDTDAREARSTAILEGFIYARDDYRLPQEFGMFSATANASVRRILDEYITAALALIELEELNTPAERLLAFEDLDVRSESGKTYDTFFGSYQ